MRYRLRTLLIALALGPPALAGIWYGWLAYAERDRPIPDIEELQELLEMEFPDSPVNS